MSLLPVATPYGTPEAGVAKSHTRRAPRIWAVAALLLVLALCHLPQGVNAQLTVTNSNSTVNLPVVQLLYDGYWNPVRFGRGPLAPHASVIIQA